MVKRSTVVMPCVTRKLSWGRQFFFKIVAAVLNKTHVLYKTVVKLNLTILPLWGRQFQDITTVFLSWGLFQNYYRLIQQPLGCIFFPILFLNSK